jgi:hypothetical protein
VSQTSYDEQGIGINGQLADTGPRRVGSYINENASGIGFGLGVKRGSAVAAGRTGLFDETSSAADDLRGVTLHDYCYNNASDTVENIPADNAGSILEEGHILVTAETAVADGDDAYVRIDDGVADPTQTTKGGWGNDDDSGTRRHVKGAKFRSAAAKGSLAQLHIMPGFGGFDLDTRVERIGEGDNVLVSAPVGEPDRVEYIGQVSTISSTTTVEMGVGPAVAAKLVAVYLDATVAAGDSTDHWTIEALSGSTSLATWDTDTGVDGALAKGTPSSMNLTGNDITANDDITVVFTKNNSAAAFSAAGTVTMHLDVNGMVKTTTINIAASVEGEVAKVVAVKLSCGITVGDSTDHWTISVKQGSTEIANWDSDTAVDGAITQGTYTDLNLVSEAVVADGAALTAVFTKNNAAADITQGMIQVELAGGDALVETTTINLGAAPAGRHMIIDGVQLSCGITVGDSTDHWMIALKNGATSIATWDSDTGEDGAITQGTPTSMNLSSTLANRVLDPGDALTLVLTKNNDAVGISAGDVTVMARLA